MWAQKLRLNKSNNYYYFIEDILSATGVCLNVGEYNKEYNIVILTWFLLRHKQLTHYCFCTISMSINTVEMANNVETLL